MNLTALLSVSDKTAVIELGKALAALGVKLVSTGGTAQLLARTGSASDRGCSADRLSRNARRPRQDAAPARTRRAAGAARSARAHGGARAPRHRADRHPRRQPLSVRSDDRQARLHARRRDREHRHRRTGDGALGREELEARRSAYARVAIRRRARRAAARRQAQRCDALSRSPSPRSTASAPTTRRSATTCRRCKPTARATRISGADQRPLRQAAGPALRREPAPGGRVLPRPRARARARS